MNDPALALRALVTLRRAASACADALAPDFTALGLTETQFGVLEALHHKGPLHPCDLAAKILRTTGNLTLVLDQLARRGLVRRERSATDRRYVTVHLTAEGAALIAEHFPAHARHVVDLFAVLTPAEQATLGTLCRTLGLHAAAAARATTQESHP